MQFRSVRGLLAQAASLVFVLTHKHSLGAREQIAFTVCGLFDLHGIRLSLNFLLVMYHMFAFSYLFFCRCCLL